MCSHLQEGQGPVASGMGAVIWRSGWTCVPREILKKEEVSPFHHKESYILFDKPKTEKADW